MSDEPQETQDEIIEPVVPKPKRKRSTKKASAKATADVNLHWVQQNILNFALRHPEMAMSAKSVFEGNRLDNEHLEAILDRDLPPELNHFIRWLLKIDEVTRTEWLNK